MPKEMSYRACGYPGLPEAWSSDQVGRAPALSYPRGGYPHHAQSGQGLVFGAKKHAKLPIHTQYLHRRQQPRLKAHGPAGIRYRRDVGDGEMPALPAIRPTFWRLIGWSDQEILIRIRWLIGAESSDLPQWVVNLATASIPIAGPCWLAPIQRWQLVE